MDIKELEKTIWLTVKRLRNNLPFYDWMHFVLGLVFLKFITNISEETADEDPSKEVQNLRASEVDREEYLAYNEFFVPKKARWGFLLSNAKYAEIGILIDEVVDAIEKLNENIRGVLPKNYADQSLDKTVLGELLQLIGSVDHEKKGQEKKETCITIFKYLLSKFAGKGTIGDQAYTRQNIAQLLVELVEPRKGIVYDGSCGAGNTFIQINKHVRKYRGKIDNLFFYGQDSHPAIIKIAKMNLMLHDLDADLKAGDTFHIDCHPDVKADFILSIPSSDRDSNAERADKTFYQANVMQQEKSELAWLEQSIYKLNSTGIAGVVLDSSSLNSSSMEERKIRQSLIDAKLVDCIVALPPQFFLNSEKPACILVLTNNKTNNKYTNAGNEVLFIDASKLKVTGDKGNRLLSDEDILAISRCYHRWKNINGDYIDRRAFCKAISIEQITRNNYNLNPARYVLGRKRVKRAIAVSSVLISLVAASLFFTNSQNSSLTTRSSKDSTLATQSKLVKDSLLRRKSDKTARRKVKERPVKEKDNSAVDALQNKSVAKAPEFKTDTVKASEKTAGGSYKVISKAYFYNQPDENTRRKAFINHWNNSYAQIEAEADKNGFIYVEFTNHLNQTSKGWLRKKDLQEVNEY